MRILGIDPGLLLTGYGVIEAHPFRPTLIDGGVIRLDGATSIAQRLVELERELDEIVKEHRPDAVAVEMLYSHYKHPRTAILMAHARGVVLLVAARHAIRLAEISANRVKQAVSGHGHASKHQMQRAIQSLFGLKAPPEPPDVADALAVAVCFGMSGEEDLNKKSLPLKRQARE
jgi:crossover junction endodeoxyribonuclease RuvC